MVFPEEYTKLNIRSVRFKAFKLRPIRFEDRKMIRNWRNEQMVYLRQTTELSEENQDNYFKTIVAGLFQEDKPKQILFSLLENNELIAYGGLVHINWIDNHAEVSFLMDSQLHEKRFAELWTTYLKMLKHVAFDVLGLKKVFTYAYDIRPHLYPVLESAGFDEEARLKKHCFVNGEYQDVLIHSMFAGATLRFREANINDAQLYFDWTNDPLVRSQSFNSETIQFKDHFRWFNSKIADDNSLMLLFSDIEGYVGQVRIEQMKAGNVISVSMAVNSRGKGYASRILRLAAIEGVKCLGGPIMAYIRKANIASVRSFESAGFVFDSDLEINKIPSLKYIYEE